MQYVIETKRLCKTYGGRTTSLDCWRLRSMALWLSCTAFPALAAAF